MAVSFVLANQSYIALVDRMEHTAHHEHAPNPLAGAVYFEHNEAHNNGHDHHHNDCHDAHHACDTGNDQSRPLAHHHGESVFVFLASAFIALNIAVEPAPRYGVEPPGLTGLRPSGPDHPPKGLATRV